MIQSPLTRTPLDLAVSKPRFILFPMARRFIIIMITCASRKEAGKIMDVLLQNRLVACANIIGNIRSKFWWMGRLDVANEVLVVCKTVAGNFNSVAKNVKNIHSYKVPEIIAVPVIGGNKPYLEWIEESVITYEVGRRPMDIIQDKKKKKR